MTALPIDIERNDNRIIDSVGPLARRSAGETVFLVDGDRTLTSDDTSRSFLRLAGLDPHLIKQRFERDGYCFDSFRFHAEIHLALGLDAFESLSPLVAQSAHLYPGALEFLVAAARVGPTFVISAGVPMIWRHVLDKHGVGGVGVIGGIEPASPYVFGRREKALVASLFLERATNIVGVGDSDVDTEFLLLAHHAVVVVNHRRNRDLLPHIKDHPSLWQVSPNEAPHQGIPLLEFPSIVDLATEKRKCP